MIARDHHRADAGALRASHRVARFGTGRIDHANQPFEDEVLLELIVRLCRRSFRQPSRGDAERPKRLAGQRFVGAQDLGAAVRGQRPAVVVHGLEGAACEQHVRSAFREHDGAALLLGVTMERAHQLPLRREGHLANARQTPIERLGAQARLSRGHQERALGRIALNAPAAVLLLHARVVRAIRDREGAFQLDAKRSVHQSAAVGFHRALGCVSRSLEGGTPARRHDDAHRHLVPGEGAGLVRRDHVGRPERFHRGQVADDRVAARHPLHADGQDRGDHRRQPFRHGGHRQRHTQNQHVEQRRRSLNVLDEEDGRNHHDGNRHDDDAEHFPGAIQLALQRSGFVRRLLQQSGDASHFGAHAGRGHDRLAVSVCGGGAAEHHVVAVAERSLLVDRPRVLGDGQALAGQRRFRRLQRRRFDQARVGWNRVALFDEDEIARDDFGGGNRPPLAAADDPGASRRHGAQRRDGRFGARLLQVADGRVEQHDGKDRDGFVGQRGVALDEPERERDGGGDEEQDDEHVLELREEAPPPRDRRLRGELVAPVPLEPGRRFAVFQAAARIRRERGDQFSGELTVRDTRFGRTHTKSEV